MVRTLRLLPPDVYGGTGWYLGDREWRLWRAALGADEDGLDVDGLTLEEVLGEVRRRRPEVVEVPALAGHGRARALLVAALERAGQRVERIASATLAAGVDLELDGPAVVRIERAGDREVLARIDRADAGTLRGVSLDVAFEGAQRSPFPAGLGPDERPWFEELERALHRHRPELAGEWRAARLEHVARSNRRLRAYAGEELFDLNDRLLELIR